MILFVTLCFSIPASTPTSALEKTTARARDRDPGDWAAGTTCSVSYYNTCTGWIWVWGGWEPLTRLGMVVEPCCGSSEVSTLVATNLYAWNGNAPPGRGYTGIVEVSTADPNGCPGTPLASHALLPDSGDNVLLWGIPVSGPLVVQFESQSGLFPSPVEWATDHPAAGPTGPAACGLCYPSTRTIHSFHYGNATTVLCPGSPLNDGVCDAEWLLWAASFTCASVSTEATSWSAIKDMYR
jgi:hypothetical protein